MQTITPVQTNWFVVTGAPCSGKTSLLRKLHKKGYSWHPEVAREYIEKALENGQTLHEIRADEGIFQKGLIDTKAKLEHTLNVKEIHFLDRAMPDSITYYRVAGLDHREVLPHCHKFRYRRIYLLDVLPYKLDHARTENTETVKYIDQWLEEDYKSLGYGVLRIPVMSLSKRRDFILADIKNQLPDHSNS